MWLLLNEPKVWDSAASLSPQLSRCVVHVTDSYSEEVKEEFRGGAIKTLAKETTECLPLRWNVIEY